MDEQNVAARLKSFMDFLQLSNSQFADTCGIPRPSLSQLLSGRNKKLSDVVVGQIHAAFPDLSVLWLMFGEGDMIVPPPLNPALVDEAKKFMDDITPEPQKPNVSELTVPKTPVNSPNIQKINADFTDVNSQPQIAKSVLPPRKVRSITVFYDDNSYETFLPEKR